MIQYKVISVKKKKLEEIEKELDNLSNYEGWVVLFPLGKNSTSILLMRSFEYPQVQEQPQPTTKRAKQGKQPLFPNAVYQ